MSKSKKAPAWLIIIALSIGVTIALRSVYNPHEDMEEFTGPPREVPTPEYHWKNEIKTVKRKPPPKFTKSAKINPELQEAIEDMVEDKANEIEGH